MAAFKKNLNFTPNLALHYLPDLRSPENCFFFVFVILPFIGKTVGRFPPTMNFFAFKNYLPGS